ncbi:cell wall protein ecm33 [Striga asiatica]|uniref:Cell wall protein ecm33 n=1 Tax=Striga asiatica TaxID=4170 RepID=A0A5A7RE03_STRAF|nr:cell wall protein ecm33 [Striga asiatica]
MTKPGLGCCNSRQWPTHTSLIWTRRLKPGYSLLLLALGYLSQTINGRFFMLAERKSHYYCLMPMLEDPDCFDKSLKRLPLFSYEPKRAAATEHKTNGPAVTRITASGLLPFWLSSPAMARTEMNSATTNRDRRISAATSRNLTVVAVSRTDGICPSLKRTPGGDEKNRISLPASTQQTTIGSLGLGACPRLYEILARPRVCGRLWRASGRVEPDLRGDIDSRNGPEGPPVEELGSVAHQSPAQPPWRGRRNLG